MVCVCKADEEQRHLETALDLSNNNNKKPLCTQHKSQQEKFKPTMKSGKLHIKAQCCV